VPFVTTTTTPVPPDEHGQPYCSAYSHYHEGACLCPECGHPSYWTHGTPATESTPAFSVSRVAVVTLGEARHKAYAIGWDTPGFRDAAEFNGYMDACHALPDTGGTVGPLPDGTTITVEPVGWDVLAAETGVPLDTMSGGGCSKIVAAFNAAQEAKAA